MTEASSQTAAAWAQANAAWVQAVLTAGAVFAAAWLQDRSVGKREVAANNRRLEQVASVALWTLRAWKKVELRCTSDGMDPVGFLGVYRPEEFGVALRALRDVRVAELGDDVLTTAVLELERAFDHARGEFEQEWERAKRSPAAVRAQALAGKEGVHIFNAAASVERRVGELVGRAAREDKLRELPRDYQ